MTAIIIAQALGLFALYCIIGQLVAFVVDPDGTYDTDIIIGWPVVVVFAIFAVVMTVILYPIDKLRGRTCP